MLCDFYIIGTLYPNDKFNCIIGLMNTTDSIDDITSNWSYAVILKGVEWFDIKLFRNSIWALIVQRQFKSINFAWGNADQQLKIEGAIQYCQSLFCLVIDYYVMNVFCETMITYDIMVRYDHRTSSDIVTEHHTVSNDHRSLISQRFMLLSTNRESVCIIL